MGAVTSESYDFLYDTISCGSSIRKVTAHPIPDESVHKILKAGRWAVFGANMQPREYIIVKDSRAIEDLYDLRAKTIPTYRQSYAGGSESKGS